MEKVENKLNKKWQKEMIERHQYLERLKVMRLNEKIFLNSKPVERGYSRLSTNTAN